MEQEGAFKSFKMVVGVLVVIDFLVWGLILFPGDYQNLELYFFDVGQGDSSLVIFPDGPKLLIDGGPMNRKLQENLGKVLAINDRYIDLVMVSHPQVDHFGGLIDILENYRIGAVLTSDQVSQSASWQELERVIKEKEILRIVLQAGDQISYQDSKLAILLPAKNAWAKDINDLGLVALLESEGIRALFTGDISGETENLIADKYNADIDILKVSHHGSKYSSNPKFLKEATPAISVIEVGNNSYGHPTRQTLARLAHLGSQIYRTDQDGLIKITADEGKVRVFSGK